MGQQRKTKGSFAVASQSSRRGGAKPDARPDLDAMDDDDFGAGDFGEADEANVSSDDGDYAAARAPGRRGNNKTSLNKAHPKSRRAREARRDAYDSDSQSDSDSGDDHDDADDASSSGSEFHDARDEYSEAEEGSSSEAEEDAGAGKGMGLADVMGKVLAKQHAKDKAPILAKAPKLLAAKTQDQEAQRLHKEKVKRTKMLQQKGRKKPTRLGTDADRRAHKLATKGVVQLFNAVNKQQKAVTSALSDAGQSIAKRNAAVKTLTKSSFLQMLAKSKSTSAGAKAELAVVDKDDEDKPVEGTPAYMRDDFMMRAKMKDWDNDDVGGEDKKVGRGGGNKDDDVSVNDMDGIDDDDDSE